MNCIIEDKSAAPLQRLERLVSYGAADSFHIEWDVSTPYPLQYVQMIYRVEDNSGTFDFVTLVDRDNGSVPSPALIADTNYTVWIRPEIEGFYGVWQSIKATTTAGVNYGLTDLVIGGELITHLGEQVQVPQL